MGFVTQEENFDESKIGVRLRITNEWKENYRLLPESKK